MLSGLCALPDVGLLYPKSVSIKGSLRGFAAQFTIRQVFQHDQSDPTDMTYGLPDNMKLCMFDLSFQVDGHVIKPTIQRKEEAELIYRLGSDAHASVCIARHFPGFVEMRLGRVPGGVEVVIEATFGVFASISGLRELFIRLPVALSDSCSRWMRWIRRHTRSASTGVPYSLEFDCSNAGYDIANVSSNCQSEVYCKTSKKLSIADIGDQETIVISVTLSESFHNDFFVSGQYMTLTFFGHEVSSMEPKNNEFVFVVDCSGSMAGSRIDCARDCLDIFLRSLPIGSYFNIFRFGSKVQCFSERSVEYNQESFAKAIEYSKGLMADLGGTALLPVLSHIFGTDPVGSGDRQLFIMTDGAVEDPFHVLAMCETNKDHNRIFTLGIGADADIGIVEGLADLTGGRSDFIENSGDFSRKIIPQLEASFYAPIPNLSIQVEGHDVIELSRPCQPKASVKSVMHVVVRSEKAFTGHEAVLINGTYCGESVDVPITSNHSPQNDADFSRLVDALFHFQKIRSLEQIYRRLESEKESKSELQLVEQKIVSLSRSSGILSELTEFVGIRSENIEHTVGGCISFIETHQSPTNMSDQCAPEPVQLHRSKETKSSCWGGGRGVLHAFRKEDRSSQSMRQATPSNSNEAKAPASAVPIDGFTYHTVISLQNMLGYWEDLSPIFQKIGKVLDMPESLKLLGGVSDEDKANAFNTIAAIAILRYWFISDHLSWNLIEKKALSWLTSVSKDTDWECLIQEVSSCLN